MQHVRHWFDLGVSIWIGLFAVYYVALTLVGLLTRKPSPRAEQLLSILHFVWLVPIIPLYWIMIGLSYVLSVPFWILLGLVWIWQKIFRRAKHPDLLRGLSLPLDRDQCGPMASGSPTSYVPNSAGDFDPLECPEGKGVPRKHGDDDEITKDRSGSRST